MQTVFVKDWLESCRQVGKSGLAFIGKDWTPYLPKDGDSIIGPTKSSNGQPMSISSAPSSSTSTITSTDAIATSLAVTSFLTSLATNSSTTSSTSQSNPAHGASSTSSISEATSTAPPAIVVTSKTLSPGAIGAIVAGIMVLVILCFYFGFCFWKTRKQAKLKSREVAILSDQVSGVGFQRYIDELLADSNSSTGTIHRHDATAWGSRSMAAPSANMVDLRSQSSSVHSVDNARAL